jgi:hypothetical protein
VLGFKTSLLQSDELLDYGGQDLAASRGLGTVAPLLAGASRRLRGGHDLPSSMRARRLCHK